MIKLVEALEIIKRECESHEHEKDNSCFDCPLYNGYSGNCGITELEPDNWKINKNIHRALLL